MANLKNIVEDFFADEPLMLQIFDTTGIFDPQNKKNIDIEFTREVQGEAYDLHRIVFTHTSDEEIFNNVHVQCFRNSLRNMQGENLLIARFISSSIEQESGGDYVARVEFITVDNIERI